MSGELDHVFSYKEFLDKTPSKPGIYDMRDQTGKTLYIGKAKNLKKRLTSYFHRSGLSSKTLALINKVSAIELIITHSETEALLLEQNLIKKYKPRYNILLKDDKSYPYIFISSKNEWPRVSFHRGKKKYDGIYFGPYPNSSAVRASLNVLQKVFKVRQCDDNYFRNRSRPCLQYQMKRCKAPCVAFVSSEEYKQDVIDTVDLLSGKNDHLINTLNQRMENVVSILNFEKAASIRDQIIHLRKIQEKQIIEKNGGNIDIIGYAEHSGSVCFSILFIRKGQLIGNKSYVPAYYLDGTQEEYTHQFLARFYIHLADNRDFPSEIIVATTLSDKVPLRNAINQLANKNIQIKSTVRGDRLRWLELANKNAEQHLSKVLSDKTQMKEKIEQLKKLLNFPHIPNRIECFDISHTMGEATVASCIVFDENGPLSNEYRLFNISGITAGDDYGAMHQVLTRRYQKVKKKALPKPDLIIIDGGINQLHVANDVMNTLQLSDIPLLGVAKGTTRKAGMETLIFRDKILAIDTYKLALLLIQYIRDEAHRFAITGHRIRRKKTRDCSFLENIPGVGKKRRSILLKFFGGRQGVMEADTESLKRVPGISQQLAQTIYDYLHD